LVFSELSLNGSWKLQRFDECNSEGSEAAKAKCCDDDWLAATVPGTIHTDLMANKLIADPFADLNEKKVEWVAQSEWWYRKEFILPPDFLGREVVELVFDGLDTFATVWLNGVKVGEAYNMFTPWRFNVTKTVKEGKNLVAVCFKPACKVASELEKKFGAAYGSLHVENFSARPYVRKAQYSFGWDWGPNLPTAGIWKNTEIIAFDLARLGYLSVLPTEVSAEKAKVEAVAQVFAAKACDVQAKFVVEGFGQRFEQEISQRLSVGQNFVECEFELKKPHLWWPRGYGEANLYDASVELYSDGVLLDKQAVKCGIRSVKLVEEPDEEGKSFVFQINGLPVFCKGACWIPADSFLPRATADRYEKLLGLASEANFNMLRVWGGGVYEDDVFYELCDRLGLMVWQDFMYACCAYPEDDWFLSEAQREAEEVIRRLRGHVCVVVWCGNNEIQWQFQSVWKDMPRLFGLPIWDKVLPDVLERLDGTRPYRPSTPYDGEVHNSEHEGNRHNWVVWSKQVDYPAYLDDKGRFLTEFGWQAAPAMGLLKEYLEPTDWKLDSPAVEAHEKQVDGLKILRSLLALHYPVPDDLEHFALYAQLNQADALKTAVTHWRSRMFKTGGCLIWQLNDCWPVFSWSLIDYGLNPKPAYYAVKRACQPVIAPLIVKDGKAQVYVINETGKNLDLTCRFVVLRFNGERLYVEDKKIAVSAYSSVLVLENALADLPAGDDCLLFSCLLDGEKVLFEDSRTVLEPKDLKLPAAELNLKVKKLNLHTFEITLSSPVYAKAVNLGVGCLAGMFSDNFFDLIPGTQKKVTCTLKKDVSLATFKEILWWQAYPYL
jgi:beta-mannosidase